DCRELNLAPEIDLFRRAQAAGFEALFVPRLTVLKFPAAQRKNVYRERPFHEQSVWLERIRSDIDFEATQLARMIATDQTTRALPVRADPYSGAGVKETPAVAADAQVRLQGLIVGRKGCWHRPSDAVQGPRVIPT